MSISNRFRDISRDVANYYAELSSQGEGAGRGGRDVEKANAELLEWVEQVGEVPRMSLEFKLTPVLLKAHNCLDSARLAFEEEGLDSQSSAAWELQQQIYRLLNDL